MPLFKDITRLGTIPVADPTQAPHATPHSEMVEFTVADYIHRDKLKALLDKLFPGNWKARNLTGLWKVTAPRKLTEAEYESLHVSSSAATADPDNKSKTQEGETKK